ncbi:hypothetical protein C8R43DRAFT_958645 [Mycena crocata]|nr:hypothetical protein C8R43DRAFT_958645 [Mycena crocata]
MQFQYLSAFLALAAGLVHAAPAADETYPLVISHVVSVGQYNMTYWSDAPGAPRTLVARACSGTNDVSCSGSHQANSGVCNQLINNINANSGTIIGDSPRAVCLGQGGNECCVSWSAAVGNMPQGDLFNAANKIFNNCFGSSISGVARNVALNGGCVTECLSNRADGCS